MYTPAPFQETDLPTIYHFVDRNGFALLTTVDAAGEPVASHLPLHLLRDSTTGAVAEPAVLVGHMAKQNSQWQTAAGRTALVVFNGPHAYVSPTWYAEPNGVPENAVPTWNYIAVHAYGRVELTEDPVELKRILSDSVSLYESGMPQPWEFDPSSPRAEALVKQIVGFRITVERWEGKWKLNQNQSEVRRRRVEAALAARSDAQSQAVAAEMRRTLKGERGT